MIDSWGIVITDVFVSINGARSEKKRMTKKGG